MAWLLIRATARDCHLPAGSGRPPAPRREIAAPARPLAPPRRAPTRRPKTAKKIQVRRAEPAKPPEEPQIEPPRPPEEPQVEPPAEPAADAESKPPSPPEEPAPAPTGDETPSETATAPRETWIMHGDLVQSLYQAGALSVLARGLPQPQAVFAGGFAAINACLLCAGGAKAIERGWEKLRSSRLLFDSGLQGLPVVAAMLGAHTDLEDVLGQAVDFEAVCASPVELHLSAGNVYFSAELIESAQHARALTVAAIQESSHGEGVWNKAMEEAAGFGPGSALLVGVPETVEAPAEISIPTARINYQTHERPRMLELILPGCGVVERLINDGRRAAERWLRYNERR